jgi:hypothetical protein
LDASSFFIKTPAKVALVSIDPVFQQILAEYFSGKADDTTLQLLGAHRQ